MPNKPLYMLPDEPGLGSKVICKLFSSKCMALIPKLLYSEMALRIEDCNFNSIGLCATKNTSIIKSLLIHAFIAQNKTF